MGLMFSIVSRLRKKATKREMLDGIEDDIKKLETTLQRNQKLQKKIVLTLLSFSILLYGVAVAVFYFFLCPDNWSERAIWMLPFACFPALVYLLKKSFHFFFVTRIKKIGKAIDDLNEQKKKILEDVTENETYKVAKELLEKFDPQGKIIQRDFAVKPAQTSPRTPSQGELRLRTNAVKPDQQNENQNANTPQAIGPANPNQRPGSPNFNPRFATPQVNQRALHPGAMHQNGFPRASPGMPTPRANLQKYPILPMERSIFDKVAEYFVGDGPSYRYALICKHCNGHNGMALKDEFEFIAFRCCYCGAPNPARKARPNAPPLEDGKLSDRESDKDKKSGAESKSDESDLDNAIEEKSTVDQDSKEKEHTTKPGPNDETGENTVEEHEQLNEDE